MSSETNVVAIANLVIALIPLLTAMIQKDPGLTPVQKEELIARIRAAQASVPEWK